MKDDTLKSIIWLYQNQTGLLKIVDNQKNVG